MVVGAFIVESLLLTRAVRTLYPALPQTLTQNKIIPKV